MGKLGKYDGAKEQTWTADFFGIKENVILQNFWILMYILNITSVVKHDVDAKVQAKWAK